MIRMPVQYGATSGLTDEHAPPNSATSSRPAPGNPLRYSPDYDRSSTSLRCFSTSGLGGWSVRAPMSTVRYSGWLRRGQNLNPNQEPSLPRPRHWLRILSSNQQCIDSDVLAVRRMQKRVPRAVVGSRCRPDGSRSVGRGIISGVGTIGPCPVSVRAHSVRSQKPACTLLVEGLEFSELMPELFAVRLRSLFVRPVFWQGPEIGSGTGA